MTRLSTMTEADKVNVATRAWELLSEILTDKYGEERGTIIKFRVTPKEGEQTNEQPA